MVPVGQLTGSLILENTTSRHDKIVPAAPETKRTIDGALFLSIFSIYIE